MKRVLSSVQPWCSDYKTKALPIKQDSQKQPHAINLVPPLVNLRKPIIFPSTSKMRNIQHCRLGRKPPATCGARATLQRDWYVAPAVAVSAQDKQRAGTEHTPHTNTLLMQPRLDQIAFPRADASWITLPGERFLLDCLDQPLLVLLLLLTRTPIFFRR